MDNLHLNLRINYRNIRLGHTTKSHQVGCLAATEDVRYFPWLGFISRQDAKSIRGATSVGIVDITRFGIDTQNGTQWEDLDKNHVVRGCLTDKGVFGVVDMSILTIEKLHSVEDCRPKCEVVFLRKNRSEDV